MPETLFVQSIIGVASELKGYAITETEKQQIISAFNDSRGTAYVRAKSAIETVIGKSIPEGELRLEKTAALNNLQNLLAQMNTAANNWQATNGK